MKFSLTLADIRPVLGDRVTEKGAWDGEIHGIAPLEEAEAGDLAFLPNLRNRKRVVSCRASVIIVPEHFNDAIPENSRVFWVDNPNLRLSAVCRLIEQQLWPAIHAGVHPTAQIDPTAEIDPTATIGAFCIVGAGAKVGARSHLAGHVFIGRNATVGSETRIGPFSTIGDFCSLGDRCLLHSGVVIGADGFGFIPQDDHLEKIPQIGRVEIGDEVEIGANSCIDRARFAVTRIGRGTKIDNQVQIGHDSQVGEWNYIAGQSGLAGNAILGNFITMFGQSGVAGHARVGDRATIGPRSAPLHAVNDGQHVAGNPAVDINDFKRLAMQFFRIDELFRTMKEIPDLRKRLEALEQGTGTSTHPPDEKPAP